jgi:AsmA protein
LTAAFKRLAIAVAAVVAALALALVALSLLIPAAAVRDAVAREIHAATGLDPVLRGDVSVSLFPSANVTFHDVLLGDRDGEPGVVAEELTAHLRYSAARRTYRNRRHHLDAAYHHRNLTA